MYDQNNNEQGVAMIFAIVMIILIMGFLAVFSLSSVISRDERATERGRAQSEVWADAAAADLASRLETGEIGFSASNTVVDSKRGRILGLGKEGTNATHGSGSCSPSYPLKSSTVGSGWYCVLSPVPGATRGTGFLNLEPSDPEHGTVTFVVRAWGTQDAIRPLDVELRFGRESLSRYAILSDAPIMLDASAAGSLVLPAGARLHSNNTSNASYGIYMRGQVDHSQAARITTTRAGSGTAVNTSGGAAACPNGNKCYVSGKWVGFNSAFTAFNRVAKADPTSVCPDNSPPATYSNGFRLCRVSADKIFPATAGRLPVFVVDVSNACVDWGTGSFSLSTDSYSYPILNDTVAPSIGTLSNQLCPASGGGALLFEGDVLVQGVRPDSSPPLTIMVRRPQNNSSQKVTLPSGTSAQVAEAASIYLTTTGVNTEVGGSGVSNSSSPLGLVAEGGIYVPTYEVNSDLEIKNTSMLAAGSGFSLGPAFQHIAGDSGVVSEGDAEIAAGGVDPCSSASTLPQANRVTFSGTLASRQVPFLSYVRGGCSAGYTIREYNFNTELAWNPPPFFPSPHPWHLVDSRVFTT